MQNTEFVRLRRRWEKMLQEVYTISFGKNDPRIKKIHCKMVEIYNHRKAQALESSNLPKQEALALFRFDFDYRWRVLLYHTRRILTKPNPTVEQMDKMQFFIDRLDKLNDPLCLVDKLVR